MRTITPKGDEDVQCIIGLQNADKAAPEVQKRNISYSLVILLHIYGLGLHLGLIMGFSLVN